MSDEANRSSSAEASPDFLSVTWRRVKEHRIAQWTVGYVAVAYGIQHAATLTSEAFDWPHAVTRISMLLLILGVPLAMTLAWYHGERASHRVSGPELTIISILLVGVAILFNAFVSPPAKTTTAAVPVQEASVTAARQASLSPGTAVSLAVMPFENLSPDPNQGWFADGIAEELTTVLTKIPDLRVVGRESAQQFKGKNENFRNIGRALNATHLLEGSVQKDGNQLRISAQLVRADTGVTIWSDAYDRQHADVFAIEKDIALSIASSLHMTLGLKQGEDLVNQRTRSAALHDDYLRARNLVRSGQLDDAIKLLDNFVGREKTYAPGWAELAVAHHEKLVINSDLVYGAVAKAQPVIRDEIAKRDLAADQALKLDAANAQALCVMAESRRDRTDIIAAMDLYQRALTLDNDEPDCLESYGLSLARLGFSDKGLKVMDHLVTVEPLQPAFRASPAGVLAMAGQTEAALNIANQLGTRANYAKAMYYAAQGQLQHAAELLAAFKPSGETAAEQKLIAAAAGFLRAAPAPAPRDAPELGLLDWVYVFTGAPERFMGTFEDHLRAGFMGGPYNGPQWTPGFESVLKTERFKNWIKASGTLAYWRAKGWPSRCHATPRDDFECS